MQVLLLAQPVQERCLLLEKRLPSREEHRSANVQPDPFPVISPSWIDDGAVPGVLRRCAATFRRVGGGGGRALSRFIVFVIVVIVVAVVSVATVMRRNPSDVCGSPLVVRCSCHLEKKTGYQAGGDQDAALRPTFVLLAKRPCSAHCRVKSGTEKRISAK